MKLETDAVLVIVWRSEETRAVLSGFTFFQSGRSWIFKLTVISLI